MKTNFSKKSHICIFCLFVLLPFFGFNQNLGQWGSFTDHRDGNIYQWVRIGNQVWMAENLSYQAGDGCWAYKNDKSFVKGYGYLYSWATATASCPSGWHLPSNEEWTELTNYLGGEYSAGKHLKYPGLSAWHSINWATNSTGFSAFPAGTRVPTGISSSIFYYTSFWSRTEDKNNAFVYLLSFDNNKAPLNKASKKAGASVRCIRDEKEDKVKVETIKPEKINDYNVKVAGRIILKDTIKITDKGIIYSTVNNPFIYNTIVSINNGDDYFENIVTGFKEYTAYYIWAYATYKEGTVLGSMEIFQNKANESDSIIDPRDGKKYKIVKIGDQWWFAENLAYLPIVGSPLKKRTGYYVYGYYGDNVEEAKATSIYKNFGVLYNWETAEKSCPCGWHLPTVSINLNPEIWRMAMLAGEMVIGNPIDTIKLKLTSTESDFDNLLNLIGGLTYGGGNLKGFQFWEKPNFGANNFTGFNALPGGLFQTRFINLNNIGGWWLSNKSINLIEPNFAFILNNEISDIRILPLLKEERYKRAFSVRCVKDE